MEIKQYIRAVLLLLVGTVGCLPSANAAFPAHYAGTYAIFPPEGSSFRKDVPHGTITVTSTGAFTGKLDLFRVANTVIGNEETGYHSYQQSVLTPIMGQFTDLGRARLYLTPENRRDPRIYTYTEYLRLRFSEAAPPVISVFHAYGDRWTESFPIAYSAHKVAPAGALAGRYTMAFRSTPEFESPQMGHGWAVVTVKPNGRFVARGRVGNGRPFLMSTFMREGGEVWFDADSFYRHSYYHSSLGWSQIARVREFFSGLLTVRENSATSDIDGPIFRWEQYAKYSSGELLKFQQIVTVEASRYTPPAPNVAIFDGGKEPMSTESSLPVEVELAGGGFSETRLTRFTLVSSGNIQLARDLTPPLTTLQFNHSISTTTSEADGTFRGTLQIPGEVSPRTLSGIILQKQKIGLGFFKGSPEQRHTTGSLTMAPISDAIVK